MPTIVTHAVVGAGLFLAVGHGRPGARIGAVAAAALSVLPDADALLLRWIPYHAPWGHRGLTHSLAFAAAAGIAAALVLRRRVELPGGLPHLAFLLALVAATHPVLDMLTDGGLGIAVWAPFRADRYLLPWRPLPVSPLTIDPGNPWLWHVIGMEAWMLWPAAVALGTLRMALPWWMRISILVAVAGSAVPWLAGGAGLRPV